MGFGLLAKSGCRTLKARRDPTTNNKPYYPNRCHSPFVARSSMAISLGRLIHNADFGRWRTTSWASEPEDPKQVQLPSFVADGGQTRVKSTLYERKASSSTNPDRVHFCQLSAYHNKRSALGWILDWRKYWISFILGRITVYITAFLLEVLQYAAKMNRVGSKHK